MNMKQINSNILIISRLLNLFLISCFAVLSAKFVWWIINPVFSNVYVEHISLNQFDESTKNIINRYPFGLVLASSQKKAPEITEKIKLTGVYLNTHKNSIAFLSVMDKSAIAKIGDDIIDGAKLKEINDNNIVINYQNQDISISFQTTAANGDTSTVGTLPQVTKRSNTYNANNYIPNTRSYPAEYMQSNSARGSIDDAKRHKLIEEFEKEVAQQRMNKESTR